MVQRTLEWRHAKQAIVRPVEAGKEEVVEEEEESGEAQVVEARGCSPTAGPLSPIASMMPPGADEGKRAAAPLSSA